MTPKPFAMVPLILRRQEMVRRFGRYAGFKRCHLLEAQPSQLRVISWQCGRPRPIQVLDTRPQLRLVSAHSRPAHDRQARQVRAQFLQPRVDPGLADVLRGASTVLQALIPMLHSAQLVAASAEPSGTEGRVLVSAEALAALMVEATTAREAAQRHLDSLPEEPRA